MNADLIDHMGTDLTVVNAARVSFAKHREMFDEVRDTRLIDYPARHGQPPYPVSWTKLMAHGRTE